VSKKVKAIVCRAHGNPLDVLSVEEQELREPDSDEVLVESKAAPINPADLNVIEGKYPIRPALPAVPGVEGAGVVVAGALPPGTHVLLPQGAGSWREACTVKKQELITVPGGIALHQAAMLRINPPTAWRMLHDFVSLKPGDWVLQNAANSGVGRAVIQIARSLGLRTVNIVRREELIDELKNDGGDVVICEGDDTPLHVSRLTGGDPILLGLNAVGGESALHIANALARGGTVVTYGAMGRLPLRIPNGLLIFKDIRWRGFWVTNWYRSASADEREEMFGRLFDLAARGVLKTRIERTYPISDYREAVAHAQRCGRSGKILISFGT
jgi:trans-2-enoyl-CoA reductase